MTGQQASNATHQTFEQYLDQLRTPWKPIETGPRKTADYRVSSSGGEITCEVKTLLGMARLASGGYDPCRPIQRKIRRARAQLHTSHGEPCCLVLNSKSVYDSLDPTIVACAAFGPGFQQYRPDHSVIDGRPPVLRFSRKRDLPKHLWHLADATLSPACNRRFSALVVKEDWVRKHRRRDRRL